MRILDPAELKTLPGVRWIESFSVHRAPIVTGKALVYVGIVAGLYVLWSMSRPGAGFFGVGARGAGLTFSGLVASGFVMFYHVAFGFICQGIGRGIQLLENTRPDPRSVGGLRSDPTIGMTRLSVLAALVVVVNGPPAAQAGRPILERARELAASSAPGRPAHSRPAAIRHSSQAPRTARAFDQFLTGAWGLPVLWLRKPGRSVSRQTRTLNLEPLILWRAS